MIKVDSDRRIGNPIEIGKFIPWENLQTALNHSCGQYGLPVRVEMDKLSEGGFFSGAEDCVVVYHANHKKDYFCYAITQKQLYGSSYLSVFFAGVSKNWRQKKMADVAKEEHDIQSAVYKATYGEFGSMSSGISKAFHSSMKKGAEKKLVEEKLYYDRLEEAILAAIDMAQYMPTPAPKAAPASTAASAQKANATPKTASAPKVSAASKTPPAPKPVVADLASTSSTASQQGSASKEISKLATFTYLVWLALGIWSIISFGPGAILTGILGFLLLVWADNLAEKAHIFFGFIVAMSAWMMVSGPIMMGGSAIGAIVVVVGAVLTLFA